MRPTPHLKLTQFCESHTILSFSSLKKLLASPVKQILSSAHIMGLYNTLYILQNQRLPDWGRNEARCSYQNFHSSFSIISRVFSHHSTLFGFYQIHTPLELAFLWERQNERAIYMGGHLVSYRFLKTGPRLFHRVETKIFKAFVAVHRRRCSFRYHWALAHYLQAHMCSWTSRWLALHLKSFNHIVRHIDSIQDIMDTLSLNNFVEAAIAVQGMW